MNAPRRSSLVVLLSMVLLFLPVLDAQAIPKKGGPRSSKADLAVSVSGPWSPVAPGEEADFNASVWNNGPATATSVQFTANLSGPATLVETTSANASCAGTNPARCSITELTSFASAQIRIRVKATGTGTLTIDVAATADQQDPDLANNEASATLVASDSADVGVRSSASMAGTIGRVTHLIGNSGPAAATNVRLHVTAPGATVVAADRGGCTAGSVAGSWTCTLGTVARSGTASVEVLFTSMWHTIYDNTVIYAGYGTSRAEVTSDAHDPYEGNNVSEAETGSTTTLPTCRVTCRIPGP